jgi:hypothetical protein
MQAIRRRSGAWWAGAGAVVAVVLFAAANALWAFEQPAPTSSAAAIVDFYDREAGRIAVGGPLSLLSLAIFGAFGCAIRGVLLDRGAPRLLADLALAGTVLALAPGLGAETVNLAAAHRAADGALTEQLALALFDVSYVLGSYAVGPGFGLLMLALGAAALRDPWLLPRPVALVAVALGVALVTPLAAILAGEYAAGPPFLVVAALGLRLLRAERQ